jgi:hypothetical protein
MSAKIIRTAINIVPWMLLVHNLFYVVFGNASDGNNTLAFSNSLGLGYLIVIHWAIKHGYVYA